MKHLKIALLALVGAFTYQANAQESSFIVKGGVNINSVTTDTKLFEPKSDIGFHIGASYEMPIASIVSIEPGVYFDTRGYKHEVSVLGTTTTTKTSLMGINVPVLAKVRVEIGNAAVFFNAGPYMFVPLSAKSTAKVSGNIETKEKQVSKYDIGSENGKHKRFNFGLNFGAGFEFNNFLIGLGYDLALADGINHEVKDTTFAKYNALKISVGYKF